MITLANAINRKSPQGRKLRHAQWNRYYTRRFGRPCKDCPFTGRNKLGRCPMRNVWYGENK